MRRHDKTKKIDIDNDKDKDILRTPPKSNPSYELFVLDTGAGDIHNIFKNKVIRVI